MFFFSSASIGMASELCGIWTRIRCAYFCIVDVVVVVDDGGSDCGDGVDVDSS